MHAAAFGRARSSAVIARPLIRNDAARVASASARI
ncbi:hypothetical protein K788_00009005 (plasmid) [Paraburkholderia caribensis MBA4]|uniref:Uncharacterized protein n=1 Tax=Paraburkholderia caribensis MBA4 TaxID=1323664 RepID=A0A0N7JVR2_9BURK|nr:hypothetical protein K788_00009005 [Paraburkholderia caribensis MBA4]